MAEPHRMADTMPCDGGAWAADGLDGGGWRAMAQGIPWGAFYRAALMA